MRYRYVGPGPQEDGDGGVVRPGEEREFDSDPLWGPWEPLEDPGSGGSESPPEPPATPPPAPPAASTPAASPATAAATPTPATDTGKGVS